MGQRIRITILFNDDTVRGESEFLGMDPCVAIIIIRVERPGGFEYC